MSESNGGNLTQPKTIAQLVAAIPVTIGVLAILGISLYLNDQGQREARQIEREENIEQREFNKQIKEVFERNANAMESIAEDSKQEVEEVKRMNSLLEDLLRERK